MDGNLAMANQLEFNPENPEYSYDQCFACHGSGYEQPDKKCYHCNGSGVIYPFKCKKWKEECECFNDF